MSAVDLTTVFATAGGSAVSIEITLVLLLLVAAAVSVVTRLVHLPYTVTLVLAGLVVAVSGLSSPLDLSADLIFYVFLPVILFEAALSTPGAYPVSYTHLRAHETDSYLVCRLLLEKKKK